jgi:hypothetical protein
MMKNHDKNKEYADQNQHIDKEITEALDNIIRRARRENKALNKVLKKITDQDVSGN